MDRWWPRQHRLCVGSPLGHEAGPGSRRARIGPHVRKIGKEGDIAQRIFVRGIEEYIQRDFHRSQNDVDGLASGYLESIGIA